MGGHILFKLETDQWPITLKKEKEKKKIFLLLSLQFKGGKITTHGWGRPSRRKYIEQNSKLNFVGI
jgi:hypothetical protein